MGDDLSDTDRDKSFQQMLVSFLRDDQAPEGPNCPAPGALAAYRAGALSEAETRDIEAHLAGCGACQAEIALLLRLEGSSLADSEAPASAPRVAGATDQLTASAPESPEPSRPTVLPTGEAKPSAILLRDTEPPRRNGQTEGDEAPESIRSSAGWFPRRRRIPWHWMGAAALGVAAVLAISVTYRFTPLMEEATRRAADADSVAPRTTMEKTKSKDAEEHAALPAPPPEEQPAPTPAPFFSDALTEDKTRATSEPSPGIAGQGLRSEPPTTNPEREPAPPTAPPPALEARGPAEHQAAAPARSSSKMAKQEASRAAAAPPAPSAPASSASPAPAGAMQAAASVRPVVVVARSNLDVTWRLTGSEIERSDDSGKTWHRQPATAGATLLAGSAPSDGVCWVTGANGTVLRSSDGRTWERLTSPTSADIVQITAWSVLNASIRTVSGERFSTNDGGQTWSKQ